MPILLQTTCSPHLENCNSSSCEFWWNLFKDFGFPLCLAGLAAYTAYYIFIKETKRDKENDERKRIQERSDKLLFFSTLITNCLSVSTQQKDNLKEYIELIKQDDTEFHLMTFLPLNDLIRVSSVLNLEDYLLAYVNKFPSDRKKSIKEFKEIMASIDFLLEIYKQIPDQIQKAQAFDYERKMQLQSIFQKAYNLCGKLLVLFQQDKPELAKKLISLYENFVNNHPGNNYDISFYYNYFFVPYNTFCSEYLMENNQPQQEILDLALNTRDGKQLFDHIKSENQILGQHLTRDFKLIDDTLIELREFSKRLLNEI